VAQTDAMAPVLAPIYLEPLNTGREYHGVSNQVPGSWFSGVFSSLGDDAWLAVEIEDGEDWNGLAEVIERPDLVVHSRSEALQLDATLREAVSEWAAQRSPQLAMHVLQKRGLAAVAVQDNEDIWRDPQLRSRGFGENVAQADLGPVTYPTSVQRWTESPGVTRYPPFRLGEHTAEILRDWLDMTDAELEQFRQSGAIFDAGA
jgi:crotonobetainyl-CoA:carnitine CoA-transferase CaiB-like acyl-CoA transferase